MIYSSSLLPRDSIYSIINIWLKIQCPFHLNNNCREKKIERVKLNQNKTSPTYFCLEVSPKLFCLESHDNARASRLPPHAQKSLLAPLHPAKSCPTSGTKAEVWNRSRSVHRSIPLRCISEHRAGKTFGAFSLLLQLKRKQFTN